jgi:hypothetical protein
MKYKYQILYDINAQYKESWNILCLSKELDLDIINNNLASKDSAIINMTINYIESIIIKDNPLIPRMNSYIDKNDILPLKLIKFD